MNKLEAKYTSQFFSKFDWWHYKIPDIWRVFRPFDIIAIDKNWVYFIEAKMMDKRKLNFSQIRDNQFTALSRIQAIIEKYKIRFVKAQILVFSEDWKENNFIDFSIILSETEKWNKSISF